MSAVVQHTPGPWEAGINPKGVFTNEVVVRPAGQFPHGEWIADCGPNFPENGESHANARLIAAAPELLAVLKRIDSVMDFGGSEYEQFDGLQEQMLAAIAKAEGRAA